ncbi:MAG: acyltransferase [Paramuribaculum sp.]|nr:acyltransferase [Paramuribaculum sp.]
MSETKISRLDYIDALRGAMILMVVYFHLIFRIDPFGSGFHSDFAEAMRSIRMPLFFFITGFLACAIYNPALFKKRLHNRMRRQLVPTVIIFIIYIVVTRKGFTGAVMSDNKAGYWFTYSLVQVWLIYAILALIFSRLRLSQRTVFFIILAITICLIPLKYNENGMYPVIFDTRLSQFFSFFRTVSFAPFFFMGVLIRMNYPVMQRLLDRLRSKHRCDIALLLLTLILFVALIPSNKSYIIRLSEIAGITAILITFYITRRYWSSDNIIASNLRILGKNTLPIYLYHMFFLTPLNYGLLDWLADYEGMFHVEFPVLITLSVIISALCVIADRLLKRLPAVHSFIFGSDNR